MPGLVFSPWSVDFAVGRVHARYMFTDNLVHLGCLLAGLLVSSRAALPIVAAEAGEGSLHFHAESDGGFGFNTGVLRGRLRADGRALGLTRVEHLPTGKRLDGSYGLLSHYRVFTRGVRYGPGAWDWPSVATLQPDGSVTVDWPMSEGRPFRLRARYQWLSAVSIEVKTTVEAARDLKGFESFVASYFNAAFTNAHVQVQGPKDGQSSWLRLESRLGDWLMFPRDAAARRLVEDGRWTLEPHPVAWVVPAEYAPSQAMAVRQARTIDLTVVLTSAMDGCFAVASPHELEGHYSTYFSLFGRDLRAGESATATVRMGLVKDWADEASVVAP